MTTSNKVNSFDTPGEQRISHSSPENGKKKQRGGVLVLVAVSMTALLAMTGLALDTGMVYAKFRQSQSAADAAALAGVFEIYNDRSDYLDIAAREQARINGFEHGKDGIEVIVNSPPLSGTYAEDENSVEVIVHQPARTSFLSVLGFDVLPYSARAVASGTFTPGLGCVYTLDTGNTEKALHISSESELDANCGVWVNSKSSKGAYVDSKSCLRSSTTVVVGGAKRDGKCDTESDKGFVCSDGEDCPEKQSVPASDPFALLPAPEVGPCTSGKYGEPTVVEESKTLNPGTYCGGIHIKGGTVKLSSGLYILRGGGLDIESSVKNDDDGGGVTFYNTCYNECTGKEKDEEDFRPISIRNDTSTTLRAPPCNGGISGQGCTGSDNHLDGILFFTDRHAPESEELGDAPRNEIGSNSELHFFGVMYFPNQHLAFTSGSEGDSSMQTIIVSKYLEVASGSKLKVELLNSGTASGASRPGRVALVE